MSEQDEELRWRLDVLKAMFDEGKIHIAQHLAEQFEKSLLAVRRGSDGKIDLSTVDSRVRSMAMAAAFAHNREEQKNAISLSDISNHYFEAIERNFKFLIDAAAEKGYDPDQFAQAVSNNAQAVDDLATQIPGFIEALGEYWKGVTDAAHYHIQDLQGSKAVYGGDLFPSYAANIASATGLYIDTIVLSDPFWNSRQVFASASKERQTYFLVKHALNAWQYRDLALADLDKPIVVLAPFRSSVDEDEAKFLMQVVETDALKHAEALFGRKFENRDHLFEFCSGLDTPENVMAEVLDASRVLFDTEWGESPLQQLERALSSDWERMLPSKGHAGQLLAFQCFGRMGQATDLLFKSRYLSGTPLIEAPTSWRYFNWKLEYNSARDVENKTHLHMLKGLQQVAATDEPWIGRIPTDALIEMRKQGAFEEIRRTLSAGIQDLAAVNPDAFFRSSDRIVDNIRAAFAAHQAKVKDLRDKHVRFAGHDLGSMIVAGAIDIASIITGTPTFGAASFAVNQLIDVPKLREIPERFRTLKNARTELKRSPMGMLFKYKN